jgi:predicted permease
MVASTCVEARKGVPLDAMLKDIRYAIRVLGKNPGFTLVAVISLALGIGANTAIFSMINALMFRPLPAERPEELISVFTTDSKNPGPLPLSHYNYRDYRDQNDVFSGLLTYNFAQVNLKRGEGENSELFAIVASGNYFDVLGIKAQLGRAFYPDEDQVEGASPVVVLSDRFWKRDFAGDPGIVGQTISLNRRDFTVIGIAPPDFTGTDIFGAPDFWAPMSMHRELQQDLGLFYNGRRGLAFNVIGRLKPGVSLGQAQQAMSSIGSQLEQQFPRDNEGRNVRLMPLLQARTNPDGDGGLANQFVTLMVIVGIVLLIACANVTNLLLARGTRREREMAIRLAIGASRGRLMRQLLTESLVLSLAGGALGLVAAVFTRGLISSLFPFFGPNNPIPGIDWKVAAFALVLSGLSGLVFGLAPALQTRPDLVPALKGDITLRMSGKGLGLSLRRLVAVLQKSLVVVQVGLSVFALIIAGLFLRSLQKALDVNPGFVAENVLTFDFNLGREGYTTEQGRQFHKRLLDEVSATPGVLNATISRDRPMGVGILRSVFIDGQEPVPGGRGVLVATNYIGSRFFETLGIPILRGRDFTDADDDKAAKVAIINDAMARRLWPNDEAVGKRFKFFGDETFREIVGIARDSKIASLVEPEQRPIVYAPMRQEYAPQVVLQVKSSGDPQSVIAGVRSAVQRIDSSLTVLGVEALSERLKQSLQGRRSQATLVASAGLLALVLASLGVYGVMAYLVAQRTREIGIRMALGARRGQVLRKVLGEAGIMVSIGVVAGIGAAVIFSGTQFVSGSLFGVGRMDPLTMIVTPVVLIAVSILATLLPARRASKIDPMRALRYE